MSSVTKLVPAKLRSSPRMRSSSSGWPMRLVDLQHHLVGHEHDVHRAARAVGRRHAARALRARRAARRCAKPRALQHLQAALLAEAVVLAGGRTDLRVAVLRWRRPEPGNHEVPALFDPAAVAGEEQLLGPDGPKRRSAVDDARITTCRGADFAQPTEFFRQRGSGCGALHEARVTPGSGRPRQPLVVDHGPAGARARQRVCPFKSRAKPAFGKIGRRRVTQTAIDHGDHGAGLVGALRRLGDILPDAELLRVFMHAAYGPVAGAGRQAGRKAGVVFESVEHVALRQWRPGPRAGLARMRRSPAPALTR